MNGIAESTTAAAASASAWRWLVVLGLCVEAARHAGRMGTSIAKDLRGPAVFASADDAVRFGLGASAASLDALREHTAIGDLIVYSHPPGFRVPLFMHVQPRQCAFLPPDRRLDPRVWTATAGGVWYLDLGTGLVVDHERRSKVAAGDTWSLWRLDR